MTDAEALARFEAFVLAQRPAQKPWEPVTPYDFESRRAVEGQHPDVIVQAFGRGPFLDWGCGPDAILVRLLRERGVIAYGWDPQLHEAWRCFQPTYSREEELFVGHYPVIVCREVFEHLTVFEIQRTIRRWTAFTPAFVYVTTRFAKDPDHFLDIDTSDDLDPTHITMLNQNFLRMLFVLEGFTRRADLEEKLDWMKKGRCLVYERA